MSRMTAAFEALPSPSESLCAPDLPAAPSCLAALDTKQQLPSEQIRSWSTSELFELADWRSRSEVEVTAFESPGMELFDCCEAISEQLLQIRDELQIDNSPTVGVQLRIFGD